MDKAGLPLTIVASALPPEFSGCFLSFAGVYVFMRSSKLHNQFTSPATNAAPTGSSLFSSLATHRACYFGQDRQQAAILLNLLFLFDGQHLILPVHARTRVNR